MSEELKPMYGTTEKNDFLADLNQDNINNFLFKIERKNYFYTQDCPAFQVDFEYKKVAYLSQFASWLKLQPVLAEKTGSWEEITEIWHIKDNEMKLVWTAEKGWFQGK